MCIYIPILVSLHNVGRSDLCVFVCVYYERMKSRILESELSFHSCLLWFICTIHILLIDIVIDISNRNYKAQFLALQIFYIFAQIGKEICFKTTCIEHWLRNSISWNFYVCVLLCCCFSFLLDIHLLFRLFLTNVASERELQTYGLLCYFFLASFIFGNGCEILGVALYFLCFVLVPLCRCFWICLEISLILIFEGCCGIIDFNKNLIEEKHWYWWDSMLQLEKSVTGRKKLCLYIPTLISIIVGNFFSYLRIWVLHIYVNYKWIKSRISNSNLQE